MSAEFPIPLFPIPLLPVACGLLMTPTRVVIAASGNVTDITPYVNNFAAVTYRGTSDTQDISIGFKPGMTITKRRDVGNTQFVAFDTLRGPTKTTRFTSGAEISTNGVISFTANGVTIGKHADVNTSDGEYVTWAWSTDLSASHGTNTGEHYNQSTGLSVITYNGSGVARAISHSLSAPPKMMWIFKRTASSDYRVYHDKMGATDPGDVSLILNKDARVNNFNTYWNDTRTTTRTFTVGSHQNVNQAGQDFVGYLFSEVSGFSALGSYSGNAKVFGPVVSTTFRPGCVMIKGVNTTADQSWQIFDSRRDTRNPRRGYLQFDRDDKEAHHVSSIAVDMFTSSFQVRGIDNSTNENAKRYIYAAFAETWATHPDAGHEAKHDSVQYSGTAASINIDVGFQPDLLWLRGRSVVGDNIIADSAPRYLVTNETDLEVSSTSEVQAITATGFALAGASQANQSGVLNVAHAWGAEYSATHSSHNGERYNAATGLSIIRYTGDGAAGRKVRHSLGGRPEAMFVKRLTTSVDSWQVYLESSAADPWSRVLHLDLNFGVQSGAPWNGTEPSNYDFTLGTDGGVNAAGEEYVAYLFAPRTGFSVMGSYTGNNSETGPIISCGFSAGFVLIKSSSGSRSWPRYDNVRNPANPRTAVLYADLTQSEGADVSLDFSDTWVQIKTTNVSVNASGQNYNYLVFKG